MRDTMVMIHVWLDDAQMTCFSRRSLSQSEDVMSASLMYTVTDQNTRKKT